jgi:tetratricopeptide (TPR) repeat protein
MMLACLALDGRRPQSASNATALEYAYGSAAALERARVAYDHHRAGRFTEAVAECRRGYAESVRQNRPRVALFYLNTLASAHFNLGEYRKAQETYITARELGLASGLPKWSAFALANLSSLYMHASDTDSALAAAEEAHDCRQQCRCTRDRESCFNWGACCCIEEMPSAPTRYSRRLSGWHRNAEIAGHGRQHGTNSASRRCSEVFKLGTAAVFSFEEARQALRRALFLRKISRDPNIFATEQKLAHLELSLGNVALARQLIDSSFARPNRNVLQLAPHLMFLTRAQVLAAQHEWQCIFGRLRARHRSG